MIILDTHVLLWLDRQDPALGPVSRERIDADPADHFIMATSLARGATLVTTDRAILGWPGPLPRQPAEPPAPDRQVGRQRPRRGASGCQGCWERAT